MKKILIANIFGIGDVLFTTPLISNLREEFEDVTIDYVCNKRTKHIVESMPGISRIYVYEKDDYIDAWRRSKREFFRKLSKYFNEVRSAGYDILFDFTLSRQCGSFFMLTGIKERIGFDYKGRGIFLTRKKSLKGFEGRHVIDHYLELLSEMGISSKISKMAISVDNEYSGWAADYMDKKGYRGGGLVAVIPGGGSSWGNEASRKRMGPVQFSYIVDRLSGLYGQVLLLGDRSEGSLCREIAENVKDKGVIVENDLDLKQYAALLNMCDLIVCNDGGPLHIAVALGKKTVSLFGPVDEKVYGPYPYSDGHRVIKVDGLGCRPCYQKFKLPDCDKGMECLGGIDPQEVVDACKGLLSVKKNM